MALLSLPSREDLFRFFIGDYSGAQPDKNTARGSDPYRLGRVVSGAVWTLAAKLLFFLKQALPDTAEGWFLDRWGKVFSFPRLAARGASASLSLRVFGDVGAPVPVNTELAHADGTLYKITSTGVVISGDGSVVVDLAAISVGVATNKGIGEILAFTSPPPGLDSAVLVAKLVGGLDVETDDAYRVRLLAHIGDPPEGGAIHDYQEWALRIPGVAAAYVWAHRRGQGTIDVAVLGAGTGINRVASGDVRGAVDDLIESLRPGNARDFETLVTTPQAQDVTCTIDIDTEDGFGWDWDDAGTGYAITAFDSTAKTITVPTAPATVQAGRRIQMLGEEATVTTRVGNVLTLSFQNDHDDNAVTWFTFSATGQSIRASGDLVRPAKFAILDLFNSLGPARSSYAKTSWTGELKRSKLFAAITDVTGIDDSDLTVPAANVVPLDTYGDSVPFLIAGVIQVLKP